MKMKSASTISNRVGSLSAGLALFCAACTSMAFWGVAIASGSEAVSLRKAPKLVWNQEQDKRESQASVQEGKSGSSVDPVSGQQSLDAASTSKTEDEKNTPVWPQTEDGWYIVTPEGGNASVHVPSVPKVSSRNMVAGEGKRPIPVHLNVAVDKNGANLVFAWHDQEVPATMPEIDKVLNGAVTGALATTLGELESTERILVGLVHSCKFRIRFVFRDQPMKMASQAILIQGRVYQLTYIAREDQFNELDQKRFLDSFQHIPPPAVPDPEKSGTDKAGNSKPAGSPKQADGSFTWLPSSEFDDSINWIRFTLATESGNWPENPNFPNTGGRFFLSKSGLLGSL